MGQVGEYNRRLGNLRMGWLIGAAALVWYLLAMFLVLRH